MDNSSAWFKISCFMLSMTSCLVRAEERLSDWLERQPANDQAYPLGLSWRVPAEKIRQSVLQTDLLQALKDPSLKLPADTRDRMHAWMASLPVTGRVPVALADPAWLTAHPAQNPVITADATVLLPSRPHTITLIRDDGTLCQTAFRPGYSARDYVRECSPNIPIDWVYVAEPDGHTLKQGVALWNENTDSLPAPGAWIWAPARSSGWSSTFSDRLIAFLATQGPAPDNSIIPAITETPLPPSPITVAAPVTANDWGEAGLLQTPTARMRNASNASITLSHVLPYTRYNIFLQPFNWFEVGFRYTDISNRPYGPASLSGSQTYKDKSIDTKFSLMQESAYLPALALGMRDVAGTGLFSSEYVVANKRAGNLDFSLGLGWGNLASRADMTNPLGWLIPSYDNRPANIVGQGGTFPIHTYFHGRSAPFGGINYQTPWDPLSLKLEYDSNNYRNEALGNIFKQDSPWNIGAVYRVASGLDISLGVERGNTIMTGFSLHTDLDRIGLPKLDDPAPVPVVASPPTQAPDWSKTAHDLTEQTQWKVVSITQQDQTLSIVLEAAKAIYWRDYLDRALAVLNRDAPATVTRFTLIYQRHGNNMAEHDVDRATWVRERTQPLPPTQQVADVVATTPQRAATPEPLSVPLYTQQLPTFEAKAGLNFNYFIGGPNAFALYQIAPIENVKWRMTDKTWVQGGVQFDVLDNFNKFTYDAPSLLPRVRTDVRQYMTTSRLTMPTLQLTHLEHPTENQYLSIYGGYFEIMYGGVGGEWLYRPMTSRWAFGIDLNEVKQRTFEQDLRFQHYQVMTGHATLYWDTGWQDVLVNLSAGRYLAGDVGATLNVSRVFKNGISMGAFATKTNVSAQQFGEGSFDKGIYITIPFDAMLTRSSPTQGNFIWDPLIRDGGAQLNRPVALYDLTSVRSDRTLDYKPATNLLDTPETPHLQGVSAQLAEPAPELPSVSPALMNLTPDMNQALTQALYEQGFREIQIAEDASKRLTLTLCNHHIYRQSLAVGRATRTALHYAPLDTREIIINYDNKVSYTFYDLKALQAYFAGKITALDLQQQSHVDYANDTFRSVDPFRYFGDIDDTPAPSVWKGDILDFHPIDRVSRDTIGALDAAKATSWTLPVLLGSGVILSSSLLDNSAFTFAKKHAANPWSLAIKNVGNDLPWAVASGTALTALFSDDPELSRTSYASSEAAVSAYISVLGIKRVVGRDRPWTNQGNHSFHPMSGSSAQGSDSFPSGHTIVAWALVTPYAEEYDAPWLYGVAAVTNAGRVLGRNHWVSDTVTSSLLGYTLGHLFWISSQHLGDRLHISATPTQVAVSWDLP